MIGIVRNIISQGQLEKKQWLGGGNQRIRQAHSTVGNSPIQLLGA